MQQKYVLPHSAAQHMIAADGLVAVGRMIAVYRRRYGATTDYEIAWVTVALRDLRVRDKPGPGWIPRTGMRTRGCEPTWSGGRNPGTWRRPPLCSPWRAVVSIRSWRDVMLTICPRVYAVARLRWRRPGRGRCALLRANLYGHLTGGLTATSAVSSRSPWAWISLTTPIVTRSLAADVRDRAGAAREL